MGKLGHGLRQIVVGCLLIAGQELANSGKDVPEIPLVDRTKRAVRRERKLQDDDASSRLADSRHFSQAAERVGDIAETERDRDDLEQALGEGKLLRVRFDERHPGPRFIVGRGPAIDDFAGGQGEHLVREICSIDGNLAGSLVPIGNRQISRAGANVENRSGAARRNVANRPPAPIVVDAAGKEMIQEVVSLRYLSEHLANALR